MCVCISACVCICKYGSLHMCACVKYTCVLCFHARVYVSEHLYSIFYWPLKNTADTSRLVAKAQPSVRVWPTTRHHHGQLKTTTWQGMLPKRCWLLADTNAFQRPGNLCVVIIVTRHLFTECITTCGYKINPPGFNV